MEISIKWIMCRTCSCQRVEELQPLFNDDNLAKYLQKYADVVVDRSDGLPDKICNECILKLQSAHKFLSACKKTDQHLKSVVSRAMFTQTHFQELIQVSDVEASVIKKATRDHKLALSGGQLDVDNLKQINDEPSLSFNQKLPSPDEIVHERIKNTEKPAIANNDERSANDMSEFIIVTPPSERCLPMAKQIKLSTNYSDDYVTAMNETEADKKISQIVVETNSEVDYSDLTEYTMPNNLAAATIRNDSYSLNSAAVSVDYLIEEDITHEAEQEDHVVKSEIVDTTIIPLSAPSVDLGAACDPSNLAKHTCTECGNSFKNYSLLKSHLRMHRTEKCYECELCFKRFSAACNLNTHMRTHTGEKPYECKFCSRRFADRSTHRKHERIHTNERPFECTVCCKAFSLSTSLKAHEAVHSQKKPHRCLTCNKGFKLPHQLKAHENTHAHRYEAGI